MNASHDFLIRPLVTELLPDFLHFFEHEAFRDNPQWASCYCHFNCAAHHLKKWDERTAEENRMAACDRIVRGEMSGFLAYAEGQVVGWCHAGPRERFTTLGEYGAPLAGTGSIVCFVIAKAERRRGLASKLLAAACDGFREQGCEWVEGYPRREANSDATHYHGPLAMFLAAGFEAGREKDGIITVRKKL